MTNGVIGIHEGHNAAAAFVENGCLVFALQEERLTRVKNQGGLPKRALGELAEKFIEGRMIGSDIRFGYGAAAIIASCWERDDLIRAYEISSPDLMNQFKRFGRKNATLADLIDRRRAEKIAAELSSVLRKPSLEITRLDHHLCHAAAAYFGWGETDEKVLVVTCDGSGDGVCATVSVGYKGQIQRIAKVEETHSIGRLYANVTYLTGMVPLEHEYKLMGLAPYAEKSRESGALATELESCFEFDPKKPLVWRRRNGCPPMQYASAFLANVLRRKRFDHVAAGVQMFLERFLVRWIRTCVLETGIGKVALSGGVFMNVKANQRILEIPELEELFVFPSCGDETNAIGVAWFLYNQLFKRMPFPLTHLYWGPDYDGHRAEEALSKCRFQSAVRVEQLKDIEKRVAEILSHGNIVARYKGKVEFGARALGNRSILANPSYASSVREINEMIKCRDFWMPFAPSVLTERSSDYFLKPKPMKAPYMMITFDSCPEKRNKMIAAIHPHDYTGRPQEVDEQSNPDYYKLLKHFEDMTGEGIILNTSFNLHGEPIVCTPEDALRVFDVSGLRYLALGDFLLSKC